MSSKGAGVEMERAREQEQAWERPQKSIMHWHYHASLVCILPFLQYNRKQKRREHSIYTEKRISST